MVSNNNDLMKALYSEDLATIKTLLENGADVNKPYNSNGYTPFMFACREFYEPEVIELFLSHGGDVYSSNISGDTPFMIAAKKRSNPATLNLLLQAGSDINAQDNNGNTAFIKVVNHPQAMMRLGLIEFFINNDADPDIKNNNGKNIWDYTNDKEGLVDLMFNLYWRIVAMTNVEEIAKLNDAFRANPSRGVLILTEGIRSNSSEDITTIINKVRNFNDFDEDNNPYGEKDFGAFTFKNKKIFWKIDYYDNNFLFLSPNACKPRLTNRVMTIMYADEY